MEQINIGISDKDREAIAQGLARLLADSYTLYLQTHNFHWNVTGPQFRTLHLMFEEQYTELATAVDDIAERIRSLGMRAPGTYKEFSQLTSVEERDDVTDSREMVQLLVKGHETVVRTCRAVLPIAQEAADEASADVLIGRMALHEKTAWMLRALLED
ncbi:Dps family protein [Pokkaliibacter sp. CJK22405]|uniref:Dps family protein n=1 Tax=Pokkaliibacter sp. CJK22405 TaxID=3384615 RepID=UPI003984E6DD